MTYSPDDYRRDRAHRERERARDGVIVSVTLSTRVARLALDELRDEQTRPGIAELVWAIERSLRAPT